MELSTILYIEINVLCIIILLVYSWQMSLSTHGFVKRAFMYVLLAQAAFYTCDVIFKIIDGRQSVPVFFNYAINIIYFTLAAVGPYALARYYRVALEEKDFSLPARIILNIPAMVLFAIGVASVFNGMLFSVGPDNVYHRGPMYFLQPLTSFLYMAIASAYCLVQAMITRSQRKRHKAFILASFIILPALGAVIEVMTQGIPSICCGVTISLITVVYFVNETMSEEDEALVRTAISDEFSLSINANITQNEYHIIDRSVGVLSKLPEEGTYDRLIRYAMSIIPKSQQREFYKKFYRKAVLEGFKHGKTDIYMRNQYVVDEGNPVWVETKGYLVEVENGDIIEVVLIRNVDNEMEATLELEKFLANTERVSLIKSEFLSNVSGVVFSRLSEMNDLIRASLAHIQKPDLLRKNLNDLDVERLKLSGVIADIVDVRRIECNTFTIENNEFNIVATASMAYAEALPYAEYNNVSVNINTDKIKEPIVVSDGDKIKKLITNLIRNSVAYSDRNGLISVNIAQLSNQGDAVGDYEINIVDNGVGMSNALRESIFEPYAKEESDSTYRGSGLSMVIVKKIVDLLDGHISIESAPGRGTSITVLLKLRVKN